MTFIGGPDLNSYNDNAQVIDATPAPFCAICKRDSQPGSPGSSAPSQPPCPPPDCCPPGSTPVLASRRINSWSMPAEQKDISKALKWKKKKVLCCIPESTSHHFLQALHLHNLPKYKLTITFKNFHLEAYKTAMWNSFVSIAVVMSSRLSLHQIKCLGICLWVCLFSYTAFHFSLIF